MQISRTRFAMGGVTTQGLPLDSNGMHGQLMHKASTILSQEYLESIPQISTSNGAPNHSQPSSSLSHSVRTEEKADEAEAELDQERRRAALEQYSKLRTQLFSEVPDISGEELLELLSKNAVGDTVVLVDCRSEAERQVSVYKGSVTIADFEANVESYKHKEIVAYCAIGRRSGIFLRNLLVRYPGIRVRNHAGGAVDWGHVGGPFVEEKTGAPTNRIHPNGTWVPYVPLTRNLQVVNC